MTKLPKPEQCPTCNRYTETGRQQLALIHRENPLTGIDLSRPLDAIIAELRREIVLVRSKLNDIGSGFTGWTDRVAPIEGLLTCGLIAMHRLQEEAREHRERWDKQLTKPHRPAAPDPAASQEK